MPLYVYECPKGHTVEALRKVEQRHDLMLCECGEPTRLQVQVAAFDPDMGLDPGFPTAYDRWAKTHSRAAKGK